jgi:hypothetical protein
MSVHGKMGRDLGVESIMMAMDGSWEMLSGIKE